MPTDTGPLRMPIAEAVPAVGQLQQQVPLARERIQRVVRPERSADGPADHATASDAARGAGRPDAAS